MTFDVMRMSIDVMTVRMKFRMMTFTRPSSNDYLLRIRTSMSHKSKRTGR